MKSTLVNQILSLTVPKDPYEILRKSLKSHFSTGSNFLPLNFQHSQFETLETDLQFLYPATVKP